MLPSFILALVPPGADVAGSYSGIVAPKATSPRILQLRSQIV